MCWQDSERKTGIWKEILLKDDGDRMVLGGYYTQGTSRIAAQKNEYQSKDDSFLTGRTK